MDIGSLIEVFRMTEVSPQTRARIIIQLGRSINDSMGMNVTEGLVYELVKQLEPDNLILENEHYLKAVNPTN